MKSLSGLLAIPLLLTACSATPTVYHTLATDSAGAVVLADVSHRISSLGVGPITLPTLLDRESLVIRKDETTVEVSDAHLWGGQLEDEFLNALAQQLQLRLPATRVQTVPWDLSQTPRYQVVVKLTRFDGMVAGNVRLQGLWQLQAADNGKILLTEPVTLERKATGKGVGGIVEAQSQLLADLANQMVRGLGAYQPYYLP